MMPGRWFARLRLGVPASREWRIRYNTSVIDSLKSLLHLDNKKTLIRIAIICILGVMLAACGGTAAPAAPPLDNAPAEPPQSGSGSADSTINLRIECEAGGIYYLDDYVQGDLAAKRRYCTFHWVGGTPDYDVKYTLGPISDTIIGGGQNSEDRTNFWFWTFLPVMPPGRHELSVEVTDSAGEMAQAVGSLMWSWRPGSADNITVEFLELASSTVTIALGLR